MAKTFTRPPNFKKGELALAWKLDLLSRAILELQNTVAPVSDGAITARSIPPFWTVIGGTDPDYTVKVTLGFVEYQNAGASESEKGVTGWIVPFVNGVSLDDPLVEPLPLPDVASWVYIRLKTDSDGVPKFDSTPGPVTIEAFDGEQQSVHHVRKNDSSGEEEGDYYFLILQTESNGATPAAPRVKRRITGNREQPNQLIEVENVWSEDVEDGDARKIHKGYMPGPDDKHQLRTLAQIQGRGEDLIKPLADAVEGTDDTVDPNTNQIIPGTPPVPAEEEGDTIKWKRLDGRLSQPQINIVTVGEEIIEVRGNEFYREYIDPFGNGVGFEDGLAARLIEGETTGGNLDLTIRSWLENTITGLITETGSPSILYWRNGLFVGEVDPGDAPAGLIAKEVSKLSPE